MRLAECLYLTALKEVPQILVGFLEIAVIVLCVFQCGIERIGGRRCDERIHQRQSRIHGALAGQIRFRMVDRLLLPQAIQHGAAFLLQFPHQFLVIVRRNALLEQVTHHIPDQTLLLIRSVLADIAQQTLLKFHLGKQPLELLRIPAGNVELLMVQGQGQNAIHKQTCNQPLYIHRQEAVRLFGKGVQQGFQRCDCPCHGVALDPVADGCQRTTVAGALTAQALLTGFGKDLTDILLRYGLVHIGQVAEQTLHLLLQRIVQTGLEIAGAAGQLGAIHIDIRLGKCLFQEHLHILAAFLHFLLLCLADCPILGDTACGAAA